MKFPILIIILAFIGCNPNEEKNTSTHTDTLTTTGPVDIVKKEEAPKDTAQPVKTYSNKRFKDVTVEELGKDSFLVKGKGQIFEANFNWIVEDGHDEIYKGFQMTDAGAPDWGKFRFVIHAPKKRENSTLTLILFESSAMDGSRQHELPIPIW